jgi:hypothetical protein
MSAECRGAADLNRPHEPQLVQRQTVAFAIALSEAAENVGKLKAGPGRRAGMRGHGVGPV